MDCALRSSPDLRSLSSTTTESLSFPVASALATLIYGYAVFQKRVTMIKRRSAEPFGASLPLLPPLLTALADTSSDLTRLALKQTRSSSPS